jgi:hypothetical protein
LASRLQRECGNKSIAIENRGIMNIPDQLMQELSALVEETGARISEHYHFAFIELLAQLNVPDAYSPIPLELWVAIAQAFADASGYRISLQAAVLEQTEASDYRVVEHREVAGVEPTLFVEPADK